VTDSGDQHAGSFADRARAALSRLEQDERVKQATANAKNVAAQAEEASRTVSRKVSQEDAWEELRGDVELLTEITRAHHALIVDLIDRVAELEAQAGGRGGG
jgi:molecular chaperone DnaK (HSP70)